MSLQTRLAALITAIGADIKALQQITNNASTSSQSTFNNDQYLAGSSITIPTGKIKAGSVYRCRFNVVKTSAGTQAPVVTVRVGTNASTADTSRAALTFGVQTAAVDEGVFDIDCVFRTAGASATIQALGSLWHRNATFGAAGASTGLNAASVYSQALNLGGSFDVTGANLKIGLSVNGGASSSWTVTLVTAELLNLTP